MKKILITLAAIGLSTAAFAQAAAPDYATADADKSGDVSLAEAQVIWPALTQEQFTAADTDGNGSLSQAEFEAYAATAPAQ